MAVAHDTNQVSPLDSAEAVGDDEDSAARCGPVQGLLHNTL